jgi:hypothetical protein
VVATEWHDGSCDDRRCGRIAGPGAARAFRHGSFGVGFLSGVVLAGGAETV